jgi:hypothetical protein
MATKNRPIIIPLMGGLGNQLFQFAVGLHLRKFSSKQVRFSPGSLLIGKNTPRSFMLGDLLRKTDLTFRGRFSLTILRIVSWVFPPIWISERDLHDFPLSRITKATKVLIGYFQRHDYVDSVSTELIQSMSQSNSFKSLVLQPEVNDIAVHIRFGDYLSNSETKKFHGLSAMTYFVNAVNHLQAGHKFDRIVIYSDDLRKAHSDFTEAFGPSEIPVVAEESLSELDDLAGMSASRGIVISNSTFSWWAAWIGTQLHECDVVAPRPWFATPTAADHNLLPNGWTVLDRELQP